MERAIILAGLPPVTADHLAFLDNAMQARGESGQLQLDDTGINLEELEKDLIKQALLLTGNNQSAAARLLGLTRSKFRTRVKQLEESS